jgi:hypothetical protein
VTNVDLFSELDSQDAWNNARRSVIVQRVLCAIEDCSVDLIPFEEARDKLHLDQKVCHGLKEIELDKIRGSVGRYHDFTSAFLPRRDNLRQRWKRVWRGRITKYFVSDGNHRVSTARQEGMETIDAYVCEYITPLKLSGEADLDEVFVKAEYAEFLKRTNLRPEHEIVFTTPGRYMEIECQIRSIQQSQQIERATQVGFDDAAEIWYQELYLPTIDEIGQSGAMDRFTKRTPADIFLWMWRREPDLRVHCLPSASDDEQSASPNLLFRVLQRLSTLIRRIVS